MLPGGAGAFLALLQLSVTPPFTSLVLYEAQLNPTKIGGSWANYLFLAHSWGSDLALATCYSVSVPHDAFLFLSAFPLKAGGRGLALTGCFPTQPPADEAPHQVLGGWLILAHWGRGGGGGLAKGNYPPPSRHPVGPPPPHALSHIPSLPPAPV